MAVDETAASGVAVEELREPTEEVAAAFARLVPQLSSAAPPDLEALRRIASEPGTAVLLARDTDGTVLGTLTLVTFTIPTGVRAIIEDVVVDDVARGRGIGAVLVATALQLARARGVRNVDLTSRPAREAANRLYERMGFVQRATNVWRHTLD